MGIRDIRVRERILREADPDLTKVMEIYRSIEMVKKQTKEILRESHEANALQSRNCRLNSKKLVTSKNEERPRKRREFKQVKAQVTKPTSVPPSVKCKFCARIHEFRKEICPAWGKVCTNCNKRNHFSRCCTSKQNARAIHHHSEEEYEEIYIVSANGPRKIMKELNLWNSSKTILKLAS